MKKAQLKRNLVTKCDPTDDEVMEVIKAVYGDPTAGRQFYQLWRKLMLKMGMKQGTTESCFWYNNTETLGTLYAISFVDDCLIVGPTVLKRWFVRKVGEELSCTVAEG